MAYRLPLPATGAKAQVVRKPAQTRIHQRDASTLILSGEMLRAKPVATGTALHHRILIPVMVTAWRVTLRRNENRI